MDWCYNHQTMFLSSLNTEDKTAILFCGRDSRAGNAELLHRCMQECIINNNVWGVGYRNP
jgi:hypothetical protein